jgi:3-oxoacyl-(acyl-carrier-protein) synthase
MVLTEGSCFLVLEALDAARERGAFVYAEVGRSVSSCDARGMYGIDDSGEAAARAVHTLLRRSDIGPDAVDYICAHANSSPAFDRKEALVLKVAFGEFAARIPVSSIKGVLGHPFGASGAFQVAAAALAIRHEKIPHTHNLEEPDLACELNHVRTLPLKTRVRQALVTSYGYGGVNAYLLLRAVSD